MVEVKKPILEQVGFAEKVEEVALVVELEAEVLLFVWIIDVAAFVLKKVELEVEDLVLLVGVVEVDKAETLALLLE